MKNGLRRGILGEENLGCFVDWLWMWNMRWNWNDLLDIELSLGNRIDTIFGYHLRQIRGYTLIGGHSQMVSIEKWDFRHKNL